MGTLAVEARAVGATVEGTAVAASEAMLGWAAPTAAGLAVATAAGEEVPTEVGWAVATEADWEAPMAGGLAVATVAGLAVPMAGGMAEATEVAMAEVGSVAGGLACKKRRSYMLQTRSGPSWRHRRGCTLIVLASRTGSESAPSTNRTFSSELRLQPWHMRRERRATSQ